MELESNWKASVSVAVSELHLEAFNNAFEAAAPHVVGFDVSIRD